jgi:arginyl-tRNA synthetase
MIESINLEIDSFLSLIPNISREQAKSIKHKYSSNVTDDLSKGHITTNVCMIAASILKTNPKELASGLEQKLTLLDRYEKVESAGPGFINITLKRSDFLLAVQEANLHLEDFGKSEKNKGKSIQIEFVSANPTGPLHVGHGRGAAYGDSLARILKSSGYRVEKEYYINDAGRQIDILTASVFIRIYQRGFADFFPQNGYKGSYISEIGNAFVLKNTIQDINVLPYIQNLPDDDEKEIDEIILRLQNSQEDLWLAIKDFALEEVLSSIRKDLKSFNVSFDHWFYESTLGSVSDKDSQITSSIDKLKTKQLTYEEGGALWLNTSSTGDDKNRVLIREDGRATYFASDIAYHKDKIDRGFDKLINVWGADHHGYIKRIEASMEGLGFNKERLNVQLVQFANLFKDGKKVKMSTRSGEFFSLSDLINEIGTDASRFYYLSKQADQHLDFDINLAKSDSKENIFYYIQYAHARIFSLQKKYLENHSDYPLNAETIISGSYTSCDKLIHEINKYPEIVLRASALLQPHIIIFYLRDFAHTFHSFYNDNHVFTESEENIKSIIYCLNASKMVLSNGLGLLGISPMEKM